MSGTSERPRDSAAPHLPSTLNPAQIEAALRWLGAGGRAPLDPSSGSWVYDYGPDAVLKLYPDRDYEALTRYRLLSSRLRRAALPFATPAVLRCGRAAGIGFAIHRRMPGRPLSSALPQLEGERRRAALLSYFHAAERFGAIDYPDRSFGHLLSGTPLCSDTWPEFLRAWAAAARAEAVDDLRRDVPHLDAIVTYYEAETDCVGDVREKRLVHGDYWPANVFMDDQLEVCGVIDFSRLTLAGDPRADAACAVMYLELVRGHQPDDLRLLRTAALDRHGPQMERVLSLYRLHYSFVFASSRRSDLATYLWCVQNLRQWGSLLSR